MSDCSWPASAVGGSTPPSQRRFNAAESVQSATRWELIDAVPRAEFVDIDDVIGEIIAFCDMETRLTMRLVCRRWHDHEYFAGFTCVMETITQLRSEHAKNSSLALCSKYTLLEEAFAKVQQEADKFVFAEDEYELRRYSSMHAGDEEEATTSMSKLNVVVCVIESERFLPSRGFSKGNSVAGDPPPWALVVGSSQCPLANGLRDVRPDRGWEWCSSWRAYVSPEQTDSHGWSYARTFMFGTFGPKKISMVRQREWRRHMSLADDEDESAVMQVAEASAGPQTDRMESKLSK